MVRVRGNSDSKNKKQNKINEKQSPKISNKLMKKGKKSYWPRVRIGNSDSKKKPNRNYKLK